MDTLLNPLLSFFQHFLTAGEGLVGVLGTVTVRGMRHMNSVILICTVFPGTDSGKQERTKGGLRTRKIARGGDPQGNKSLIKCYESIELTIYLRKIRKREGSQD